MVGLNTASIEDTWRQVATATVKRGRKRGSPLKVIFAAAFPRLSKYQLPVLRERTQVVQMEAEDDESVCARRSFRQGL